MCGRYYVDDQTAEEVKQLVCRVSQNLQPGISTGDVRPAEPAWVLLRTRSKWQLVRMKWGYPGREGSGLVINARSETVLEKPMFADSIRERRCVIPISGFYEWNSRKEKYKCFHREQRVMYLAGCFKAFEGENRFVILTTKANPSMAGIHERMPLVLPDDALTAWTEDCSQLTGLLAGEPEPLLTGTDYEQMILDLF